MGLSIRKNGLEARTPTTVIPDGVKRRSGTHAVTSKSQHGFRVLAFGSPRNDGICADLKPGLETLFPSPMVGRGRGGGILPGAAFAIFTPPGPTDRPPHQGEGKHPHRHPACPRPDREAAPGGSPGDPDVMEITRINRVPTHLFVISRAPTVFLRPPVFTRAGKPEGNAPRHGL